MNSTSNIRCVKLETDVWTASTVPFSIHNKSTTRQGSPVAERMVVSSNSVPSDTERCGAAPVHCAEPRPLLRDLKGPDNVPR